MKCPSSRALYASAPLEALALETARYGLQPLPLKGKRSEFMPRIDVVAGSSLLNANRVQLRIGDRHLRFIASSHPGCVSYETYAKLLWNDKVRCVASLEPSDLLGGPGRTHVVGDYTFRTLSETSLGHGAGCLRHGEMTYQGETRPICLLQTDRWYDGTALKPGAMEPLLAAARPYANDTIAVHCEAGLGRTGTFIAASLLEPLRHVHPSATEEQLALRAIHLIRFHRPGSVETLSQIRSLCRLAGRVIAAHAPPPSMATSCTSDLTMASLEEPEELPRDGRSGPWVAPQAPKGKACLGYFANRAARWALAPVDFLLFGGGEPLLDRQVPIFSAVYCEGALRSLVLRLGACAQELGSLVGLVVGAAVAALHPGEGGDTGATTDDVAYAGALLGSRLFASPFVAAALLGTYLTAPLKALAFLIGAGMDRLLSHSEADSPPLGAESVGTPTQPNDAPIVG